MVLQVLIHVYQVPIFQGTTHAWFCVKTGVDTWGYREPSRCHGVYICTFGGRLNPIWMFFFCPYTGLSKAGYPLSNARALATTGCFCCGVSLLVVWSKRFFHVTRMQCHHLRQTRSCYPTTTPRTPGQQKTVVVAACVGIMAGFNMEPGKVGALGPHPCFTIENQEIGLE